jgi:hypothetical protein
MDELNPNAVFQGTGGFELNPAPDGYVIYQAARERVHFLNPTAAIVFELCLAGKSTREVEDVLQEAFGLAERPTESVRDCIRSLLEEGLIEPCPPSSSAH